MEFLAAKLAQGMATEYEQPGRMGVVVEL